MGDLTKILDGTVEEVKDALAGLSRVDLQKLREAEAAGENRKGVLTAVDAALDAMPDEVTSPGAAELAGTDAGDSASNVEAGVAPANTVDTTNIAPSHIPGVSDTAGLTQDNLTPATQVAASGAFIEPEIVDRIDVQHPAVDNNPRKGQPKIANQIDFNDPKLGNEEAVAKNLANDAQG